MEGKQAWGESRIARIRESGFMGSNCRLNRHQFVFHSDNASRAGFPNGFANITGDPGAGSHLKTSQARFPVSEAQQSPDDGCAWCGCPVLLCLRQVMDLALGRNGVCGKSSGGWSYSCRHKLTTIGYPASCEIVLWFGALLYAHVLE